MQMLVQVATSPPQATPVPIDDPASMQLVALTGQQMQSISRLVQLEGDRVALKREITSATPKEAEALRRQLTSIESEIDGENAKVEALKGRIAEAKQRIPVTGELSVPPRIIGRDDRVFGMTKNEAMMVSVFSFPLLIVLAIWLVRPRRIRFAPQPIMDDDRLTRLEQAVESVAIEVERISESQRFQAKLMAEKQPQPERVR